MDLIITATNQNPTDSYPNLPQPTSTYFPTHLPTYLPSSLPSILIEDPRRGGHRRPRAPRRVRVLGGAGSGSRAAWPRPAVSRSVSRRPAPVLTRERPRASSAVRRCRWRSRGTALPHQNARRCIEYMSRSSFALWRLALRQRAVALSLIALRQLALWLSV